VLSSTAPEYGPYFFDTGIADGQDAEMRHAYLPHRLIWGIKRNFQNVLNQISKTHPGARGPCNIRQRLTSQLHAQEMMMIRHSIAYLLSYLYLFSLHAYNP